MTNNNAGWDFGLAAAAEWTPWGQGNNATARVVAAADGYHQAQPMRQPLRTSTSIAAANRS